MSDPRDDRGTTLILALVFIFAIGIALVSILSFAGSTILNAGNAANQRNIEVTSENATTLAIENVRGTFTSAIYSGGATCLPAGGPSGVVVWCVGDNSNKSAIQTRKVEFYTCSGSAATTTLAQCKAATRLYAYVVFDDLIPGALPPNNNLCGTSNTQSCGVSMNVVTWDVRSADS